MSSSANPVQVDHDGDEEELSFDKAFANTLTDEDFHDVELEGSDGVRVPANRIALAMRSKFFRKMLMGRFNEASSKVVAIGAEGSQLKTIVEYVCTGKAAILAQPDVKSVQDPMDENRMSVYIGKFQTLLSLSKAAEYFNLPGLFQATLKCLSDYLEAIPTLTFTALEACSREEDSFPTKVKDLAWFKIRSCEDVSQNATANTLGRMSSASLELIARDFFARKAPSIFAKILCKWVSFEISEEKTARHSLAKELIAKYVSLEQIDIEVLSSYVATSQLVTVEKLAEAYRYQAVGALKIKRASALTWEGRTWNVLFSNNPYSVVAARLDCPTIKSGIHQWTIEMQGDGPFRLGIISIGSGFSTSSELGSRHGTWGFGQDGIVHANGDQPGNLGEHSKFSPTSKVTLTLNLLPETAENGFLSISVDGKPTVQGVSGLLAYKPKKAKKNGCGFVPCASIGTSRTSKESSSIRIISFTKL